MSPTEQSVFDAALSLPEPTRAHLAEALLASLGDDAIWGDLDQDIKAAWLQEAKRRMLEIERGTVQPLSDDQVTDYLRRRAGR